MFFSFKKRAVLEPVDPVIQVFVRHCNYSSASAHKKRMKGFSHLLCHQNFIQTLDERVQVTYFLDEAVKKEHFIEKENPIRVVAGTEALSFLKMIDYVKQQPFSPNTALYFLEDDYIHQKGWIDILIEGFSLQADYLTLYDHNDKYTSYPKLKSQIFASASSHWRSTPSTTNTFATRFSTFQKDFWVHRFFSLGRKVTADHDKFCFLRRWKKRLLISAMPGWSTHAEPDYASPCIDWERVF